MQSIPNEYRGTSQWACWICQNCKLLIMFANRKSDPNAIAVSELTVQACPACNSSNLVQQ